MPPDTPPSAEITTPAEFEASLGRLLAAAVANGVDPRGSWVFRGDDGLPDWEAMIYELERADGD